MDDPRIPAGRAPDRRAPSETWRLLLGALLALFPAAGLAQSSALPPEAQRWVREGLADYRRGNYLQAATAFERARDLAPSNLEVSDALGRSLLLADKYVPARAEYDRFLTVDPRAVLPRLGLARIAVRLGDYDEAMRRYREVLSLEPTNAFALYNLGWLLYRAGDYAEASGFLERLIARLPEHADAHYSLGMTYFKLGDLERAEAELRRTVELNPKHGKAQFNLAKVYMRLGRREDAQRAQAAFLDLSDRASADKVAEGKARDLILEGDHAAALAEYDRLLAERPESPRFLLGRALCLLELDRAEEAVRALETAAQLDPEVSDTFYHLAAAYQRLGILEKSEQARLRFEALETFGAGKHVW